MAMIIGVRFREVGRVYYFDPGTTPFQKGDRVIVETARGVECGEVMQENTDLPEEQIKRPLKQVIRAATQEDLRNLEGQEKKEAEAFKVCEEKILKHGLDMKLVNVEYTFDASKIIFHFTADQRVDFRALVRDLAGHFRTRIELRQIGVRDEAKLLGGLGYCGRPFCCSTFMGDFHPVSIKMAKEQGLSLNPTKISGTCGRLMCCLKYEEAAYEAALKELPSPGSFIDTPEGRGMVVEVNAISKAVKVKLDRRADAAPQTFQYDAIEGLKRRSALREDDAFALPEVRVKVKAEEEEPAKPSPPPRPQRKPDRPPPAEKPAPAEKSPPAAKTAAVNHTEKAETRSTDDRRDVSEKRGGKNWRERHAPRRQDPPHRQTQPQQPQQPQQQKKPPQPQKPQQQRPQQAERPQHTDVKAVPRYGEVRRANAPQQQNQGGSNYHRQPWQKGRGEQKQGSQKKDGKQ